MLAGVEFWDHLCRIGVVFRAHPLALEEELQFRSEVRDAASCAEYRQVPRHSHRRITPVDPVPIGTFTDGEIKHPRGVWRWAAPHIVLMHGDIECLPSPGCELP